MAARSSDNEISRVLSVLSEPTRIQIIRLISGSGELRSCDLLPEFEITQPTLSHHLNVLLENDVLTSRKEGRCVYFSVNRGTMTLVAELMQGIATGSAAKPVAKKTAKKTASSAKKEEHVTEVKPGKKDEKAVLKDKSSKVKKDKDKKDKDKKKKKKDKKDKKKKK